MRTMRHHNGRRKLNRTASHRLVIVRNTSNSLISREAKKWSRPRSKGLRSVVEALITLGTTRMLANRRQSFNRTLDPGLVTKPFKAAGPRCAALSGGNRRILNAGFPFL